VAESPHPVVADSPHPVVADSPHPALSLAHPAVARPPTHLPPLAAAEERGKVQC